MDAGDHILKHSNEGGVQDTAAFEKSDDRDHSSLPAFPCEGLRMLPVKETFLDETWWLWVWSRGPETDHRPSE